MDFRAQADQLGRIPDGHTPLETYEPELTLELDAYAPYIGNERVEGLRRLAEPLQGKTWAHVNSTFAGGGVAEMLYSVIPLARSMGIDAQWYCIRGDDAFFGVTKKFHNTLQGLTQYVSLEELFDTYLGMTDRNAKDTYIYGDLVVVHDPQPVGLLNAGRIFGNVLWRCHIDTSNPDPVVWRFLRPYINQAAGAIFTLPEYVGPGLNLPIYQVMPCIDPLAEKNRQYTDDEALEILGPLFNEHNIDPDRPIIAAISRYDPHKNQTRIYESFKKLKQEKQFKKQPYLIFIGNTASDDPEGGQILKMLRESADGDPDVRFWVNVENNNQVVGAMMHFAEMFVHVSTKEGFGLVVTEAMWQGTPVIGSSAGGITQQVIDGKTGYVVDPLSLQQISHAMARVLDKPDEAAALAKQGQEHIRSNFLLPELLRRYFTLMRYYLGIDDTIPEFRLNQDLTADEWMQGFRRTSVLVNGTGK
ncbi:glycosyltransferase [bacterium]|nr:glycosyltransferase [bacterium]